MRSSKQIIQKLPIKKEFLSKKAPSVNQAQSINKKQVSKTKPILKQTQSPKDIPKIIHKSIPIKSNIQAAKVLLQKSPHYPKVLQKRSIGGLVTIELFIDKNHKTSQFKVLVSSGHSRLDLEALKAAKKSKYQAQKNEKGAYIGSYHKLLFRFKQN